MEPKTKIKNSVIGFRSNNNCFSYMFSKDIDFNRRLYSLMITVIIIIIVMGRRKKV